MTALRRLRGERLSAAGLAALVAVTAFLAAGTPRLMDRVADETLRTTIRDATPAARNIQFLSEDRLDPSPDDPFVGISLRSDEAHRLLPRPIADLVGERAWQADTPRFSVPQLNDPVTMRLRIMPGAMERMRLTEGRWPTATTRRVDDQTSPDLPPPQVTSFEVAISDRTAGAIGARVGDILGLVPDSNDPLARGSIGGSIAAEVVGIYRLNDEADPWFLGSTELIRPSIRVPFGDLRILDATALLAPEAYAAYMAETLRDFLPVRYTFREYVDPARLDSSQVAALLPEFRRLEAALPSTQVTFNQPFGLRTGLRAVLDTYLGHWAAASAILAVGATGPAAVAAAALGLVAVFAAQRRRATLALSRGRGASLQQVVGAVLVEGLLLAGPPAAIAIAAALLLIRADPVLPSVIAGIGVAVLAILLLVIATVPATSGPSVGPARDSSIPRRTTARRLILEGFVIAIALAGAYLLRERGLRGTSSAGEIATVDPLVAAVPALIGLAGGLLAVRLFPYPLRFLAVLARRRPDLVPILALRHATQGIGAAPVLIVLLAAATIGAFSSAVLVHLDRSAEAVAWRAVGAAYRIDSTSGTLQSGFDPAALPDVEAAALAWKGVVNVGPRKLRTEFIAIQAEAYDRVVAGTPADFGMPLDLLTPAAPAIPLVASAQLAGRTEGVSVGDEFPVTIEGYTFPARVVAIRGDLPAFSTTGQYVIASRDQIQAMFPRAALVPTGVFLRAPATSAEAIATAVATQVPVGARLFDRAAETEKLRTSPVSKAVAAGITVAALIAAAYAVLAVAAALALSGTARAIEMAHLRTLGLTDRQAAGLVVVEHGPTVALAFAGGIALGLGIFVTLRQGLGLEVLVGSSAAVPLTVEPAQLAIILGGIVAVIGLGLLLGALMQRGTAPVAALRRGFE
ncbi:MAG: hypothetical protein HYX57_01065 [Chloroflexi bacterium]|nr:hypothetical protein [Chloroflexota bacterium]